MGKLWNTMSEEEKRPYTERYNREKAEYEQKMSVYLIYHPEEASKKQKKEMKKK